MRNFDRERLERRLPLEERRFTIGGQEFVAKGSVHPDILAGWDKLDNDTSVEETMEIIDGLVREAIEPWDDARARWTEVRARKDRSEGDAPELEPVNVDDLLELCKWLIETQTGRPTGQPDGSTGPLGANGTSSTGGSSSTASPAAQAA